jgi:MFS family permease
MNNIQNTTAHKGPDNKTPSSTTSPQNLIFKNGWQEFGFVLAVMLGQSFNLTPLGAVNHTFTCLINYPKLIFQTLTARWLIADDLGVPGDNGQMSWIAAGFSITTGSFVLVGGRLGDIYGHRLVWLLALTWSMVWNLGNFPSGLVFSRPLLTLSSQYQDLLDRVYIAFMSKLMSNEVVQACIL